MTLPWLGKDDAVLWHGDVRAMLAEVPDGVVQCVVTSPPYWGLRDYGVEGQLGLERTPAEFVATMVEVFREVRRVLRPDGVCWLNLGDCYATGAGAVGECPGGGAQGAKWRGDGRTKAIGPMTQPNRMPLPGLKPKDLIGIPWRVAFALQEDGWWLRSDGIWSKPNPMPESVTDRLTKAHEYIFLLAKSERYYWDKENAKESAGGQAAGNKRMTKAVAGSGGLDGIQRTQAGLLAPAQTVYTSRNLRSVWEITTRPYPGAHFATFPPEIPRRCIRASTPEGGCCATCRTPYRRIVEKGAPLAAQRAACGADSTGGYGGHATKDYASGKAQDPSAVKARILAGMVEKKTIGWAPQCACPGSVPAPALVLDPFAGSGTTLAVAIEEGRRALGFELNPEYIGLALDRIDEARGRRAEVA